MAGKRYDYVPADAWMYVGAGLVGLDKDVGDLESAVEALKSAASTGGATVTWASVMDKPSLATVATSGKYTDLTSRPTLSAVASSGAYTDLTGRPDLTGYAPKASPTFTGTVTLTGTTVTGLTKATVGLGNVDNTPDASKAFATSQITSGVFPAARLGTGTANSSTFLAGDGTWKTAPSGGGTGTDITIRQYANGSWPTVSPRVAGAHYRWLCGYDTTKWPTTANGAASGDELVGPDETVIP